MLCLETLIILNSSNCNKLVPSGMKPKNTRTPKYLSMEMEIKLFGTSSDTFSREI